MQPVLWNDPNAAAQEAEEGVFNSELQALTTTIRIRTTKKHSYSFFPSFLSHHHPPKFLHAGLYSFFYCLREALPFPEASCPPGRIPRNPKWVPAGKAPTPSRPTGERPLVPTGRGRVSAGRAVTGEWLCGLRAAQDSLPPPLTHPG